MNKDLYIFIKWSDADYSVGIKTIDDQHKELIKYINQIYQSILDRNTKEVTIDVLGKLEDYAKFHFGFEEKIFSQIGYEFTEEHIAEHRAFTDKIKHFKDGMAKGHDVIFSITNYLRDWLRIHIQKEDRKYAPEFQKLGME
ncbi:bacteriohemerythrin [uncultured Acetobacteroides sp.]|uniref:bacteriohemerythrin n=1 Tax=uncultured Acetobacteroides sp. TaxID=1760811 RepID=UPI0029F59265|nr:bacteriohemerythrin [uncultured Acetobacteroides sp.]